MKIKQNISFLSSSNLVNIIFKKILKIKLHNFSIQSHQINVPTIKRQSRGIKTTCKNWIKVRLNPSRYISNMEAPGAGGHLIRSQWVWLFLLCCVCYIVYSLGTLPAIIYIFLHKVFTLLSFLIFWLLHFNKILANRDFSASSDCFFLETWCKLPWPHTFYI